MGDLSVAKGTAGFNTLVYFRDAQTGLGKTGLVAASFAGTKFYVMRADDGNAGATAVTVVDATRGTWSSGGIKEKDAVNAPGWYEVGLTTASFATGAQACSYAFVPAVANSFIQRGLTIELGGPGTLVASERDAIADAILNRDMSVGTDSGSTTVRTVRQALRFLRNKWSIASGTLTVCKEDDTAASWTAAITTDATQNAVKSIDPAG